MKKTIIFLSLVLATMMTMHARLLWKITPVSDSDTPVSYLLGTYHLAGYDTVDSITGVSKILDKVSGVVAELDMAAASSFEGRMAMMRHATAPADSTLSTVLSSSRLDSLQLIVDRYMPGVRIEQFEPMCPAFVSVMIETSRASEICPLPVDAVDAEVQRRALESGKSVRGLETVDEQCLALFGAPIIEQAESLAWNLEHDSELLSLSRRIFEAYISGDINEILAVIENERYISEDESERLIRRRNADWLRILAGLLPAASLLIVVGAGHLPGNNGLIEGLRKKGYDVTPVTD